MEKTDAEKKMYEDTCKAFGISLDIKPVDDTRFRFNTEDITDKSPESQGLFLKICKFIDQIVETKRTGTIYELDEYGKVKCIHPEKKM